MKPTTDKALRAYLLENEFHKRVRIRRDGGVDVYTSQTRGDGGPVPWWKFVGWKNELKRQMEIEAGE